MVDDAPEISALHVGRCIGDAHRRPIPDGFLRARKSGDQRACAQARAIDYEYWTCTTLAPGSDPNNPKTTGGAEIIAPIDAYRTPAWSANLSVADESLGPGSSRFEKLRYFKNWPSMGIAYAAPDMQGGNFWGVINHDNEEGIIRIADNTVTPGLKMWTWGFPSFTDETDPRKDPNPARP